MLNKFNDLDFTFMRTAFELAQIAAEKNEVPVGAILVKDKQIIGRGYNSPISLHDPSAHAEILALKEGGKLIQNYRLTGTSLYVTLEPCLMCLGALIHARISKIIFGAEDPKYGSVRNTVHKISYQGGILAEECSQLLKNFFQGKRL